MQWDELDLSVQRAVEAIDRAARYLSDGSAGATRGVTSAESAMEVISVLEDILAGPSHDTDARAVSQDLRAAKSEIRSLRAARERSVMAQMTRQIARIRSARTVDDLADAVPFDASGLGYERVMFSWVEGERWVPRSSHTLSGPLESRAMLSGRRAAL